MLSAAAKDFCAGHRIRAGVLSVYNRLTANCVAFPFDVAINATVQELQVRFHLCTAYRQQMYRKCADIGFVAQYGVGSGNCSAATCMHSGCAAQL
jgi:hypothetical protein